MTKKENNRGQIAPFNTVSVDYLTSVAACRSGIARFKKYFPEGIAAWPDIVEEYTRAGKEEDILELAWFIQHNERAKQVRVTAADALKLYAAAASEYRSFPSALIAFAQNTPASVKEFTWQVRCDIINTVLTLDRLQYGRGSRATQLRSNETRCMFATCCPPGVKGSTFEARLNYADKRDHPSLAVNCPSGVVGATWAERCKHVKTWYYRRLLAFTWTLPATFNQRLSLLDSPKDRAALAQRAPATVRGATWKARLAVCKTAQQRNLLARHAPHGTPGATWEARLRATSPHARARLASSGKFGVSYKTRLAALTTPRDRAYFAVTTAYDVSMPWDERVALLRTDADRIALATQRIPCQYKVPREMRMALLPDSLTGESRDDAVALINALTTQ